MMKGKCFVRYLLGYRFYSGYFPDLDKTMPAFHSAFSFFSRVSHDVIIVNY